MQKIIVTGFPHTGTTILKSIIGHIQSVKEIVHEEKQIHHYDEDHSYRFNLCKWPFAREHFFGKEYNDYIKVFIMRNPLWVFSSLNKRCAQDTPPGIPPNHDIDVYAEICDRFLEIAKRPRSDVFLIKYEELFDNNYEKLRNLFDQIGFEYTDDIFQNDQFHNFSHRNITNIPSSPVPNVDHENYRTWQINQPFVNNNRPDKLDLLPHQIERILQNNSILTLYPDIPDILATYCQ